MNTQSSHPTLAPKQAANYGFAVVRDVAFDAVRSLWRRRQFEGMTQGDLASKIGRDPAWVSRNLKAPGNWTLRTLGELIYALDGEVSILVSAIEDAEVNPEETDAYSGYLTPVGIQAPQAEIPVIVYINNYDLSNFQTFTSSPLMMRINLSDRPSEIERRAA